MSFLLRIYLLEPFPSRAPPLPQRKDADHPILVVRFSSPCRLYPFPPPLRPLCKYPLWFIFFFSYPLLFRVDFVFPLPLPLFLSPLSVPSTHPYPSTRLFSSFLRPYVALCPPSFFSTHFSVLVCICLHFFFSYHLYFPQPIFVPVCLVISLFTVSLFPFLLPFFSPPLSLKDRDGEARGLAVPGALCLCC